MWIHIPIRMEKLNIVLDDNYKQVSFQKFYWPGQILPPPQAFSSKPLYGDAELSIRAGGQYLGTSEMGSVCLVVFNWDIEYVWQCLFVNMNSFKDQLVISMSV